MLIAVAIAASAAAGFLLGEYRAHENPRPSQAALRRAPHYVFTNQLGQTVSSASFAGKVQIVTFLFPYCTTYCPLIAGDLVQFEQNLAGTGLANDVRIVTFNVDPAGSGAPQMRAFMKEYGWNPHDTRWQFLTGSPAAIRRVVYQGYAVYYARESLAQESRDEARQRALGIYVPEPSVENTVAERAHVDYDVVHNDVMEIVGPDGQVDKIFDQAERVPDDQLLAVIRALVPNAPQ